MGVMQAMGLEDSQVLGLLVERWPGWAEQVPDLALLADPEEIWREGAGDGRDAGDGP